VSAIASELEKPTLGVVLTGSCYDEGSTLHAALVSPDSGFDVVGSGLDVEELTSELRDPRVVAVLHGTTWNGSAAVMAETLAAEVAVIRRSTTAPIILLAERGEDALVDAALAAGVDDVLVLPQPVETIAFAVRKAGQAARNGYGAAATADEGGRVITVFSPKGGTGKTVLSTNIGAYLASKTKKRVLLIDLDLQFGDAAIMLGIDPQRTMYELVQSPGELDPGKLASYTTRHRSGLDVLAAPMLPEHADLVTEAKVLRLVEVAREAYDLIVIDTSPFFYGPMMALLGPTDQLLLLCGLDVPTLKNVRLSLRTLELLGFPPERMSLVLNRVTPSVGLTAEDVAEALGTRVAFEVPNDPVVAPAVNRGAVPSLQEAGSEFAVAVARIAGSIQPTIAVPSVAQAAFARSEPKRRRFVPRRVIEGRV